MANKKMRKRKRRVRYDRVAGFVAVVTFGVIGLVNMVSTKVSALPNTTKELVKNTKAVVESVSDVAVDKVKVDYVKKDKELQVNVVFDTSYELRSDVVADAYKVALAVVEDIIESKNTSVEKCVFDIDLKVATTYDMITKSILEFEISNLGDLGVDELGVYSFETLTNSYKNY